MSPAEGADINSATIVLVLDIQNFTLNGSAFGLAPVAGEGHYHLHLDGAYRKADYGLPAFLPNVPQGTHMITVELAENDHSLLGVNASVNVTVTAGAPRLLIASPGRSLGWNSSSVELQVQVGSFSLNAAAIGQAPAPGEGHYHVYVNGSYFGVGTTPFFNVTGLAAGGKYTLRVELAQNDHTLLSPAVFDEVRVETAVGARGLALDGALKGALVNASSVRASFAASNFTVNAAAVGQPPVPGEGHYVLTLDGVRLGPGAANPAPVTDLAVGSHTLALELVDNSGASLAPRVVDWAAFTVRAGAPRLAILTPQDPSTVNSTALRLTLAVGNFSLEPTKIGQASVEGEGHYHILVDDVYIDAGAALAARVLDLAQGPHIIMVELRNNDHSALVWPSFDVVRVVVPAGAPSLRITSPAGPAIVNGSSVTLSLAVANFTLSLSQVGGAPVSGQGHWHLLVDGAYVGFGASLDLLASRLAPGTHVLTVELFNNDHTSLTWPAFDELQVTVRAGAPTLAILAPTAGFAGAFNFVGVTLSVANFTLAPKYGQPAQPGEGHVHVFIDGVYLFFWADTSISVPNLAAGSHTLRIELRNNDHTPLADPVADEVAFVAGALRPTVAVSAPAANATLYGGTTTVSVQVANFTLAPAAVGQASVAGEGHWRVLVDGLMAGETGNLTLTLSGLALGTHLLKVELRNNDRSGLGADISSTVTVHVVARPSIRITSPPSGYETAATSIAFTVEVVNLTLDPVTSTSTNAPGHGHFHVLVDGTLVQMSSQSSFTLANLGAGTHTVSVMLAQNDHAFIAGPGNASQITVTVREAQAAPPGDNTLLIVGGAVAAAGAAAGAFFMYRRRARGR